MEKGNRESRGGGGGSTEDQSAICLNPQQVLAVGPTSTDTTTPFATTTNVLRVNYAFSSTPFTPTTTTPPTTTTIPPDSTVEIRIQDYSGQVVAARSTDVRGAYSFLVNLPPAHIPSW